MECPICKSDLSPFDIQYRNEHITLCLENGPSVVEFEAGRPVIRKIIPTDKQRKICPICSKTFQNIHTHFKSCALKNDLNPDLMQDYWFKLNDECKTDKCFPRDLLESYIEKCTKEGRLGEQVEFANALLQTLPEDTKRKRRANCNGSVIAQQGDNQTIVNMEESNDSNSMSSIASTNDNRVNGHYHQQPVINVGQVLMQNATNGTAATASKSSTRQPTRAKTPLELADKATKKANIALRMERELSATSRKRYLQALEESNGDREVQMVVADQGSSTILKYTLMS